MAMQLIWGRCLAWMGHSGEGLDSDSRTVFQGALVRGLSRAAAQSNWVAKSGIDTPVANAVGTGIVLRSAHPDPGIRQAMRHRRWNGGELRTIVGRSDRGQLFEHPAPGLLEFRHFRLWARARWMPPTWNWVDPEKDVKASALAIQHGLTSRARVVAESGEDVEAIDAEQRADSERAQKLNLPYGMIES